MFIHRIHLTLGGLFALFLSSCATNDTIQYEMEEWELSISSKGQITHITDKFSEEDHCPGQISSPVLSLKLDSSILMPAKAVISDNREIISFYFDHGIRADVRIMKKKRYITFELIAVSDDKNIDAVIWGPYAVNIRKSIGETIGIVQDDLFTLGLQALNLKTLGGYPWKDNDHLPQLDIFEQEDFNDLEKGKRGVLYSVEAAKPADYGSSLQAYTRNRKHDRIIANWQHDYYVAPAYDDGGIVGSKIALFGCPTDSTLAVIGQIEIAEGLPHPMINRAWVKTSPVINSSYLIMNFTEQNIEECLSYAKKSGFNYLYHGHPFESWGHFPLIRSQFPNGWDGMKTCVKKAEAEGIYIGTHTLTNFIHTTDSYVTPVPDRRLAKVGSSTIVRAIDNAATAVEIKSPLFFNQFKNNHLQSVVIGDEIIRYGTVTDSAPWILKDCTRGAFGTRASGHSAGSEIGMLTDHAYRVFLGDVSLNREIAEKIADFMNYTGVRMLDFDGLEGTHSTGMGNYAEVLFAQQWFDHLNDNIKNHYLLGASRSGHYFWHIFSRMNWGEPWYAGFRESQTEYRLKNQNYFKRNLMPGMLGWFKMTGSTTIEDIEWLMTRSAAYNAGFAFVTDLSTLTQNGKTEEIFSILNTWETARLNEVFTESLQKRMQDLTTEFHLERTGQHQYRLTQKYSHKFRHTKKVRQPGEPLFSTFNFENPSHEQPLDFMITAVKTDISNITIEINNHRTIALSLTLKDGQTIKYSGRDKAIIYDQYWNEIAKVPVDKVQLVVPRGNLTVNFDCAFQHSDEDGLVKLEFIVRGIPENLISW